MVRLEELKVEQLKQELGKRSLRTTGTKAELKQRLVEQLEKDGLDPLILEFEYNIEGKEQADNLLGAEKAATAGEKHSEEKGADSANETHEQLDARINAQEENADAFKKEMKTLKKRNG
ncbi:heterogeneous nuclear ribonucleoprotein U-like [Glossina fuscipes]|uniref:Heterogeneous nuclear ribonucleoprotein U-like n=1 Tax=Glossina fuscipes TaxID=7396 RepID=A0A9C5ZHD2_9MUSC|nr:heterogeneous nuclear ribonucleoprotein U-like [Glossina fuscipes]